MAAFSELASRLSHDRHLRACQFEPVCRWYLDNDPVFQHQIRKIWLTKDWPGRWGVDAGIDLVAETHSGELSAVPAKAYAPTALGAEGAAQPSHGGYASNTDADQVFGSLILPIVRVYATVSSAAYSFSRVRNTRVPQWVLGWSGLVLN